MAKAINLSPIQRFVEDQMTDACLIVVDPEGTTDDVFDESTGVYTPVNPDTVMIYSGKCFLAPLNVFPSQSTEGGATTISTDFELHVPKDSPQIPVDAAVVITASMRDANLVGNEFVVRSKQNNSFAVDQTVRVFAKEERIVQ